MVNFLQGKFKSAENLLHKGGIFMNTHYRFIQFFSILGGFLGAAIFQFLFVGLPVEAEESPVTVLDSISVKQLNLYNHKNEVVAKLSSDSFGLPKFEMGRNDMSRIDFNFITENQPAITVVGGLGRSVSVMSVRNHGPYWEPMISLGHRDQGEGVLLSLFNDAGNVVLTNNQGDVLKLDASQGSAWRNMAFDMGKPLVSSGYPRFRGVGSVRYSPINDR